jgi:hypothetical protein
MDENFNVVHQAAYDTHGDSNASSNMAADLDSKLPTPNFIVVAAVKDEAYNKFYSGSYDKFESLGSTKVRSMAYRDGWAFISANIDG